MLDICGVLGVGFPSDWSNSENLAGFGEKQYQGTALPRVTGLPQGSFPVIWVRSGIRLSSYLKIYWLGRMGCQNLETRVSLKGRFQHPESKKPPQRIGNLSLADRQTYSIRRRRSSLLRRRFRYRRRTRGRPRRRACRRFAMRFDGRGRNRA
jgi:hypothetical protein